MSGQSDSVAMWTRQGPYLMEWNDFGRLATDLAEEVRQSGFRPTVICGIARGGLVAAAHLATVLDDVRLVSFRVRRTTTDQRYAGKQPPVIQSHGDLELRTDDRVLVVDDIVGTGETAVAVLDYLRGLGVSEIRIAALVVNHQAPHPVDHQGFVSDDWVIFPWEAGWHDRPAGWRPMPR